jgi:hypothetical protein
MDEKLMSAREDQADRLRGIQGERDAAEQEFAVKADALEKEKVAKPAEAVRIDAEINDLKTAHQAHLNELDRSAAEVKTTFAAEPLPPLDPRLHPGEYGHIYNHEVALDRLIEQTAALHANLVAHKDALRSAQARAIERGDVYDSARGHQPRRFSDPPRVVAV